LKPSQKDTKEMSGCTRKPHNVICAKEKRLPKKKKKKRVGPTAK